MVCPMISCKRLEPYMCEGAKCAWWIGDKERGECAVKELATSVTEISAILDMEQLSRILNTNK